MSGSPVEARDLRLLPVAIGAWSVAATAILLPRFALALALLCVAVCGGCLLLAWRGRTEESRRLPWRHPVAALVSVAAVVAAGTAFHVAIAQPARDEAARFATAGWIEATGTVETKVEPTGDSVWFSMRAQRVVAGSEELRGGESLRVIAPGGRGTDGQQWGGVLDLGSTVTVRGSPGAPGPGAAEMLVLFADDLVVERDPPHMYGVSSRLRSAFVDLAARLPGTGGQLLPGLSVGETSAVSPELDEAMKDSSLSHLTAVSGANCALIVGMAFGICAALGLSRGVRVAASLLALGGFVLLVTPEDTVIRAATMSAIAMFALLLGRTGTGVAVLSLAVSAILIADPWLALSFGFVLSVAATAALLLLAGPLARGMERVMPGPLALALAVPLAAQLVCGPIIVLLAPGVALYGVPANLVAGPAAPLATVAGLAACLLTVVPPLATVIGWIAWLPSAWIAATAEFFAALPRARIEWWGGAAGFLALAGVGACLVILVIVRPEPAGVAASLSSRESGGSARAPRRRLRRPSRMIAGSVLAVTAGLAVATAAMGSRTVGPLTVPRDWSIAACDVGQGDALLVRSAGQVALIDTGPDPELLTACLDRLGVGRVDLLVLTHFDLDHRGGAAAVADRVGLVLHGPIAEDTGPGDGRSGEQKAAQIRAVWQAMGDPPRVEAAAGDRGMLGEASWRVLWPERDQRLFPPGNDTSVVVEFSGGGLPRSLFLGDLSADAQRAMTGETPIAGPYAVVKVAHHGSADQLDELYVEAEPSLALVTVGENDYGHPREEVLSLLESLGTSIARTDRSGLVLVSGPGSALAVWRER